MSDFPTLKATLKRGALVAAANWPVVVIQFVSESTVKLLLGVPVVGGVLLVGLALGRDISELLGGDAREIVAAVGTALSEQPMAFASFVLAIAIALVGGGVLGVLVKGGTVTVMAAGERRAGEIEHVAIRVQSLARASGFSVEGFLAGSRRLFRRYLRLALALLAVYLLSGGLYLGVVFGGYRAVSETGFAAGWTVVAAVCSVVLLFWITVVNLLYLLLQMTMAIEDCSVRNAVGVVVAFLESRGRDVAVVFLLLLGLALLAATASFVATAGLSLISFVPLVGFAVFPLQAVAWLLRGLLFQYLGLTSLGAYLALYRTAAAPAQVSAGLRTVS